MEEQEVRHCPYCGGKLSEIRELGNLKWTHCSSCLFNFTVLIPDQDYPKDCFEEWS